MLKKLMISTLCLASVGLANIANAGIETALANICAIVEADDKNELRLKLRTVQTTYSIKLKDYYDGISCNSMSLIRVAMVNDSSEAGTLLVKKMPKKSLAAPESDGKTLLVWIDENGLMDHPVALAVKDRL